MLSTLWWVPEDATEISIGGPIANTRLHLLTKDLAPVPGEVGSCASRARVSPSDTRTVPS